MADFRRCKIPTMELRSIKYFIGVAELGSISRAAEELGVVQPALTRHIKQLEGELGVTLLNRLEYS